MKKEINIPGEEFIKKINEYTYTLLERKSLPWDLKLINIESRKASINKQLNYIEHAKKKLKLKIKKLDEQKSQLKEVLTSIEKDLAEKTYEVEKRKKG